jgi:isopentenyl phosphate kinase
MCCLGLLRLCRTISGSNSNREGIRVVFLTDVAGVYDRAPHHPGATLIREVMVSSDGTVGVPIFSPIKCVHQRGRANCRLI